MTDITEKDKQKSDQSEKSAAKIIAFLGLYLAPFLFIYVLLAHGLHLKPRQKDQDGYQVLQLRLYMKRF